MNKLNKNSLPIIQTCQTTATITGSFRKEVLDWIKIAKKINNKNCLLFDQYLDMKGNRVENKCRLRASLHWQNTNNKPIASLLNSLGIKFIKLESKK